MVETHSSPRKLVAVDIVDYSRLMGINEDHTIAVLQRFRRKIFYPLIEKHHGRLANAAGDSHLIEFPSAVDALQLAREFQSEVASRNSGVSDDLKVVYRMGVNLGDVCVDESDLLGDGVNMACRIESQAPPGGIYVSRSIRDQVRDRLDIDLVDHGEIQVKNIARPVSMFEARVSGFRRNGRTSSITSRGCWFGISCIGHDDFYRHRFDENFRTDTFTL